jgi:hypothetical protein
LAGGGGRKANDNGKTITCLYVLINKIFDCFIKLYLGIRPHPPPKTKRGKLIPNKVHKESENGIGIDKRASENGNITGK